MKKIAIFIPVHNEAETLGTMLSCVPKAILGHRTDIFVVDDASTDGSAEIAREFACYVGVLPVHSGVGAATKTGLVTICNGGCYDYIVKFDGDGQHDINLLPQVVAMLREGNRLVICSRFHPLSDQSHTPIDRILLNMIFTEMVRKITGWEISDARSGFVGMCKDLVAEFAHKLIVKGYGIPMEIILRSWHARPNARICELPHPAIYGGNISEKLKRKYSAEKIDEKATRLQAAFSALLEVVEDLRIPKEQILDMNGFIRRP